MADPIAATIIAAYRGCGRLVAPVLPLLLRSRALAGKEDPARRNERMGRPRTARPDGPLVWVHAASVGETLSVLALIEAVVASGPCVLLTTGTVSSATVAASRLPARTIHQFVPLDVPGYVGRFLDHWRPQLAIFVESEIWPATVVELQRRGIRQVVVNGRLSARSARRWLRLGRLAPSLFGRLTLVAAQSEADAERLRAVGARSVVVTGNLKFDAEPPGAAAVDLAALAAAIDVRPVWLAASTHPGEEAAAAAVHRTLQARFPDLLTIIVPRHPARGDEVRDLLERAGIVVAQRSRREAVGPETGVLLADTIGEIGLFYRLAGIVFVGGTLSRRGGHSPIEAAALGAAVLHGPDTASVAEIYRALDRAGAALEVADAAGLADALGRLLADPDAAGAMAAKAVRLVAARRGVLARTLAALEPVLAPLRRPGGGPG